ncbi:MAG TPA: DUF4390 domain-containing protein [Thermodesulfovibrionales bacterium]|nr:DUF4390 domain-containing protein [Thermodesulfovibrionales bacterium]
MIRIILYFTLFLLAVSPIDAFGTEIIGPEVRVTHGEIVVTAGLALDEKNLNDLKSGISKEITFYVDLFRFWKMWPNEFVAGKKIVKTLRCDPIKKEYMATAFDGATLTEKRFKSFDSMLDWTLNIRDLKLIHEKELQQSEYFVRVTAESRLRNIPPIIGYLLFFVEEREFKVAKDSPSLATGTEK